MGMVERNVDSVPRAGIGRATVWLTLALLAMLSVLLINGKPLFYFDTVGYISQGHTALRQLGWKAESPLARRVATLAALESSASGEEMSEETTPRPDTGDLDAKGTVDGSRSAVYAVLAGLMTRIGAVEGLIVFNVVAVFLALWIPLRVAARRWGLPVPLSQAVAMPIIAASLGSLPFFVAYLMPDTFAPVLILVAAALTVFGRAMRIWEIAVLIALGTFAITTHLSHLAIGVLLVPASALVAVILSRRRWWLPPALVLLIVGIGFSEQSMLRTAAKTVAHSEVVIKPYITARLIEDGPALVYLDRHCPNAAIPTCKLHAALQWSDDDYRLTASHIVFETSARLGSFRLMTPEDQKAVADDQIRFFFSVLREMPVATTMAFARNMLLQSGWVSVDMTIPDAKIIAQHEYVDGLALGEFGAGRITGNTDWLGPLTTFHEIYYVLALAVTLALVLWPGRVPAEVRGLAVMVLFGILANALVCGGISQPATRYGARVIWLLPMIAAVLIMFARQPRRSRPATGEF